MKPITMVFPLYIYVVDDIETLEYICKYIYQFKRCGLN